MGFVSLVPRLLPDFLGKSLGTRLGFVGFVERYIVYVFYANNWCYLIHVSFSDSVVYADKTSFLLCNTTVI